MIQLITHYSHHTYKNMDLQIHLIRTPIHYEYNYIQKEPYSSHKRLTQSGIIMQGIITALYGHCTIFRFLGYFEEPYK